MKKKQKAVVRALATVLYLDTLFLSNFMMNLLALSLTGALLHLPYPRRRALLAAALGGVYACVAVLFAFPSLLHIAVGVILSALLLLITFGGSGGRLLFLRTYALFYFASVLLGGGIEALFSVMEEAFGGGGGGRVRPADAVLCLGFLAYLLLSLALRLFDGGGVPRYTPVRITYEGKSVTLSLLVDSGCLLSDPITGKRAIVVSRDALRGIFPEPFLSIGKGGRVEIPRESKYAGRCRLIPASGMVGTALMLAVRADAVILLADGAPLDALVAISPKTARFGGAQGLLPLSLLRGRGKKEQRKVASSFEK